MPRRTLKAVACVAGIVAVVVAAVCAAWAYKVNELKLAYMKEAGAAERVGNFAVAVKAYRKALELDRKYLPARTGLAGVYSSQGAAEQALREQRRGVECDPRNPEAHAELARLCLEWRRDEEALRALRRAVALSPRDAYLRLMLVHAYRRKGNLPQALKEMAALEGLAPDSVAVRAGRAAIGRQMKRAGRSSGQE